MELDDDFKVLIADNFKQLPTNVHWHTRFKKDLKADAVGFLTTVLAVEGKYRCYLEDERLAFVDTVGDLALALYEKSGKRVYQEEEGHGEEL